MSEDSRHCPDCGGSDGFHFSDCSYDGTDGRGGYSFGSRGSSSGSSGMFWLFSFIALIVGYGINELIGAMLLIGIIFWACVCK